MNPIQWVQELQGPALIAVICGLLFLEEVGVPLFFAPGDIVLAISGIAIAGGRVNATALVVAAGLASVSGALIGREVFALLGWQRLMRLAEPLHARKPLERAGSLLNRGGARAVFTARLIPGLRVYTTQVAGASGVPRLTFIAGLLPASVVYLGAFIGLGVAVGRPVLALIGEAEHQALLAIGLLLVLGLLVFLARAPLARGLAALQAAGWRGPLRLSLDAVGLTLVLGSLGLNFAGHSIAEALHLPLFLDSIGTILAGVLAGPWVGASVGFISNLIAANTVDPIAAPYAIVSFMVGFAAGLSRYLNWQKRLSGWLSLWVLVVGIAALVSTPLNFLMSGGRSGVALGDSIYSGLISLHVPRLISSFLAELSIDLPDKAITIVAALLIAQGLGEQPVSSAPRAEIDLREAFSFVFRSRHWLRRLMMASACLLFSFLVLPFFLLTGYVIAIARGVRAGRSELPPWTRRWRMIGDGVLIIVALLLWALPGPLLTIPAAVVNALQERPGESVPVVISAAAAIVAGAGSVWLLLLLVIEAAIIAQFLEGGFFASLNPRGVIRRLRVNLAFTVVTGALVVLLTTLGLIGLAALLVGVLLTLPYASFVGAYIVGLYARQTDPRLPLRATGHQA